VQGVACLVSKEVTLVDAVEDSTAVKFATRPLEHARLFDDSSYLNQRPK
jgi:hypothetical protein